MILNKKVIIFDVDGTLIDSIGVWNDIDQELIERIGNIKVSCEEAGRQREKILRECDKTKDAYIEYCKFLKSKYNSALEAEEIKDIRYKIANSYLTDIIDYKPDAEKVLKYLKEKGFILVIATTTGNNAIDIYKNQNKNIIAKAKFEEIFEKIYAKEDVKKLKPNPEVHYKILEDFNIKPEECLIIEDSIIGVEAANNANIEVSVIYDKYSDEDRESINKLAKYNFMNFSEMLSYIKNELGEK